MRRPFAGLSAALVLAACQGGGGSSPSIDAAKALRDGAAAMAQWQTASATLKVSKGTISLQGFALVTARTAVRLPADSDTTYTVKEQDVSFSLQVVIASGHVYVHIPLSGFHEATSAEAAALPDMARLFDPTTGLPNLIPQGSRARYVSTDQVGGISAYQIATSYTAPQVSRLLPQLNSNGPVAARIWVGVADHQIRKALLDGTFGDGGKDAAVEVDITGFDEPVTITSPNP
jgi:hypothetical protein